MTHADQLSYDEKCHVIIWLGKAAHASGASSIRLEIYLTRLTSEFGIFGQFHSTPTGIVFAFSETDSDWQKIHLSSVSGGLDLTRLLALDDIVDHILAGSISSAEAKSRLNDLANAKDPYGKMALTFGYMSLGAGIAGLFGGSWTDILVGSVLSVVVYFIVWFSSKKGGSLNSLTPMTTSFAAGVLAAALKHFIPDLNFVLVTLAAVIVLIPGYSISMGVAETLNRHILSGLTNLTDGVIYLVKQFLGAWLALTIVNSLWPVPTTNAVAVDQNWLWLFVPAIITGLIIVFQTPYRYFYWAFLCSALGYLGYLGVVGGGEFIDKNVGNVIGGAVVGVLANLWELKTGKPGPIVMTPSITLLVSGSIGFRGLFAKVQGDAAGTGEFMDMFIVALTLTAGIVIANTIVKPKMSL